MHWALGAEQGGMMIILLPCLIFIPLMYSLFTYPRNTAKKLVEIFTSPDYEFNYYHGSKNSRCCLSFKVTKPAGGEDVDTSSALPVAGVVPIASGGATQDQIQQESYMRLQQQMMQMQNGGQYGQPQFGQPMAGQVPQFGQPTAGQVPQYGQPTPQFEQPQMVAAVPVVQAQPTVESVQVQVPIYGGGGTVMTEYNGHLINVPVPADATPGATIWVEVPDMYKRSKTGYS